MLPVGRLLTVITDEQFYSHGSTVMTWMAISATPIPMTVHMSLSCVLSLLSMEWEHTRIFIFVKGLVHKYFYVML